MTTIAVKYIDTTKYKVTVQYDDMWREFSDYTDLYKIVQFRDSDFSSYESLDDYCTENGKLSPSVQAKLRAGIMFTIVYRRYSSADGGFYHLDGGIPTGEVNTSDVNGFIIFEDEYIKGTSYEQRKEYAKQYLKTYTEWCNGEVYFVNIETDTGLEVDSCGGFVGSESVDSYIKEIVGDAEYDIEYR